MSSDPLLQIVAVRVEFDGAPALHDVDLDVDDGEIVALLGPSGCGKSTLLRSVAGLEPLTAGTIRLRGRDLAGIAPHARGVGLMFQDHVLFSHQSVGDNVAFGPKMQGVGAAERAGKVAELLELVGLEAYEDRPVTSLSGGEAQRVALARALAPDPGLLMLDEPLGSLDRNLRERLAVDVRHVLRRRGIAGIVVTHDHNEAFTIGDRVAVMDHGQILQTGTPVELRTAPTHEHVARFLGLTTIVDADVSADGRVELGWTTVDCPDWPEGPAVVVVRPEAVVLGRGTPGSVVGQRYRGDHFLVDVAVDGGPVVAMSSPGGAAEGDRVEVAIDPAGLSRLPGWSSRPTPPN